MTATIIPEVPVRVKFTAIVFAKPDARGSIARDRFVQKEFEARIPEADAMTLAPAAFTARYIEPMVSQWLAEVRGGTGRG
jgi:hypothetical protein